MPQNAGGKMRRQNTKEGKMRGFLEASWLKKDSNRRPQTSDFAGKGQLHFCSCYSTVSAASRGVGGLTGRGVLCCKGVEGGGGHAKVLMAANKARQKGREMSPNDISKRDNKKQNQWQQKKNNKNTTRNKIKTLQKGVIKKCKRKKESFKEGDQKESSAGRRRCQTTKSRHNYEPPKDTRCRILNASART